jgi:hypothetical protein
MVNPPTGQPHIPPSGRQEPATQALPFPEQLNKAQSDLQTALDELSTSFSNWEDEYTIKNKINEVQAKLDAYKTLLDSAPSGSGIDVVAKNNAIVFMNYNIPKLQALAGMIGPGPSSDVALKAQIEALHTILAMQEIEKRAS